MIDKIKNALIVLLIFIGLFGFSREIGLLDAYGSLASHVWGALMVVGVLAIALLILLLIYKYK